ncbi:MAG: glycosyltransferase [Planctomycetia bacterium]
MASTAPAAPADAAPALWLMLPAYNEAANLAPLLSDVAAVHAAWGPGAPRLQVVVVDDGSQDDTAAVAQRPYGIPVTLVPHGRNRGLGAAMRTGIEHVLAHAAPQDVMASMDADHTHPPEALPGMWARVMAGADLVIASRYQPGAEIHGLVWYRRWISSVASWVLRLMFPGARDYTCGYRLYRVALLDWGRRRHGREFLNPRGFRVMVDLLLMVRRRARRIDEVPLLLRYDRKQGVSKMKLVRTSVTTLALLGRRFVGNPRGP